jgi:hypothetical protein
LRHLVPPYPFDTTRLVPKMSGIMVMKSTAMTKMWTKSRNFAPRA